MNDTIVWLIWIVGAYLIGGIPFGFLIGKMRGVDVRTVGSKNIGATNVFRTVGKKWGLLAFFCDVMKGFFPTLAASMLATRNPQLSTTCHLPLCVGIMTVVGHMLTPYMKFKGGKGVATAFGMLIALLPATVGIAFAIFAITFACSNYISLGSCGDIARGYGLDSVLRPYGLPRLAALDSRDADRALRHLEAPLEHRPPHPRQREQDLPLWQK